MKTRLITFSVLILLAIVWTYFAGYRLDGLSAAKANSFVPRDSVLMEQVDFNWGSEYIFDSAEKPITAISLKKLGFLWLSRASVYYFHNDDAIKTIGGVSLGNENERATVISILVNDPDVTYIEAGPLTKRVRKEVVQGKPVTLSWNETIRWNDLSPTAINSEGIILYEYRYAHSNFIRHQDLR